jgi:hypothetical protein
MGRPDEANHDDDDRDQNNAHDASHNLELRSVRINEPTGYQPGTLQPLLNDPTDRVLPLWAASLSPLQCAQAWIGSSDVPLERCRSRFVCRAS